MTASPRTCRRGGEMASPSNRQIAAVALHQRGVGCAVGSRYWGGGAWLGVAGALWQTPTVAKRDSDRPHTVRQKYNQTIPGKRLGFPGSHGSFLCALAQNGLR